MEACWQKNPKRRTNYEIIGQRIIAILEQNGEEMNLGLDRMVDNAYAIMAEPDYERF